MYVQSIYDPIEWHLEDKKAISVGVAYVGYKAPEELEMFTEVGF